MNFVVQCKELFFTLAQSLFADLNSQEELGVNLEAENSEFIRFNNGKVRQNSQVRQAHVELKLQAHGKTGQISFSLSNSMETNLSLGHHALKQIRNDLNSLPLDPYQTSFPKGQSSEQIFPGELLPLDETIRSLTEPLNNLDFCGLYASGPVISATINSNQTSHWFSTENFLVDYSLYQGPKAVKGHYSDSVWRNADYSKSILQTKNHLNQMQGDSRKIAPGNYKVYLSPSAMSSLFTLFGWSALSFDALQRGHSPFKKLALGESFFSPSLYLRENFSLGLAPQFNELGELSEPLVSLISEGRLQSLLVSSQSAREFSVNSNGAGQSESPRSLEIMPGQIAETEILKALNTGIYISNLHYLNWSNPLDASVTGMTRFACFWVENGQVVSPIEDMRFDVSLYDILGKNLIGLTDFQETCPTALTYSSRTIGAYKIHDNWSSSGGIKTPGALIADFKLTF